MRPELPRDPHANLKKYTPHTATLSFELKAAASNFLGEIEKIGPTITAEQAGDLHLDKLDAQIGAIFRAFTALELDFARYRHGQYEEPSTDD